MNKWAEKADKYNKSSFIPLDEIIEYFNNLNGIGKLAVVSLITNTIILSCVISIIYSVFGNYLISKFNLEHRYPSLYKLINLRLKFYFS